jgi:hypothetical protein
MSAPLARMALAASTEEAALVEAPGLAAPGGERAELCIAFGEAPAGPASAVVRFLHAATAGSAPANERIVAPASEPAHAPAGPGTHHTDDRYSLADQLVSQAISSSDAWWRRSPWPAADALFELPAPDPRAGILVAGGSESEREELVAAISARSLEATSSERLTRGNLERAAAVVLLAANAQALPAQAPGVLAARRLLLTRPVAADFGFAHGIHRLAFADAEEAADLVESAARLPYAYEALRVWGRWGAERHRASAVYARLSTDLELEGALGVRTNSSSASST